MKGGRKRSGKRMKGRVRGNRKCKFKGTSGTNKSISTRSYIYNVSPDFTDQLCPLHSDYSMSCLLLAVESVSLYDS